MRHESKVLRLFFFIIIVISCSHIALSQHFNNSTTAGKPVIFQSVKEYQLSVKENAEKRMVLLQSIAPEIIIDLKYGSRLNFTGQILYHKPLAYVRIKAAKALKQINDELKDSGYLLKIWDAYRPYYITKKMWNLVHDRRFVANPAKGSGHNRGAAVDVTLVDKTTGREVLMPTDFDNFTEKAAHNYTKLPEKAIRNRALLKKTMRKYGFLSLNTEWWHYILPGATSKYEVMDLSFEDLKESKTDK